MAATSPRRIPVPPRVSAALLCGACVLASLGSPVLRSAGAADGTRFARSDSDARYLHRIHLYDAENRRISPESQRPYSPVTTCGRCHDYETISHGWHFNAFLSAEPPADDADAEGLAGGADESPEGAEELTADAGPGPGEAEEVEPPLVRDGRRGAPWIWTDVRTGTQLPLSYRDWSGMYGPGEIGITPFEMTTKFGPRLPGGGVGAPSEQRQTTERWQLTGALHVDCMVCHAVSGAYDFQARREQIEEQNFAWAPTAALHLATIDGSVSRIREGTDPESQAAQARLPELSYDEDRFGPEGTVFFDLVREPDPNACYQCHSNRRVDELGIVDPWIHDQDVHLRAGMVCADCHRNGIGHHIVRGFTGEAHPAGDVVQTLTCRGCHLGPSEGEGETSVPSQITLRAGRLGAPRPAHAGLPRVHFEELSCTACHGGPAPREEALRVMTSLAHGLGKEEHRTGVEMPAILSPVFTRGHDGKIYPQRALWPAFWGSLVDGHVQPLPPERVFEITRRTLRVRRDFVEEIVYPEPSRGDLRELLGEDRAALEPSEWTEEETARVEAFRASEGERLFHEKVDAALAALEEKLEIEQAVYISTGVVYARGEQEGRLVELDLGASENRGLAEAAAMLPWPLAHPVRPAGWALGVAGCTECHSDDGRLFTSTVTPAGPGPHAAEPIAMQSLQGIDPERRRQWNQLFGGRSSFKFLIATSLALLGFVLLLGAGAKASRLVGRRDAGAGSIPPTDAEVR